MNATLSKKIALETINLRKSFGSVTAVNDISFKIGEGTIVGILGPNGAGKTTTIRLITGVFKLDGSSQVKVFSEKLTNSPKKLKKHFGIVPEISNAYSDFTVWQNLQFSGTVYGLSKEKIKSKSQNLLKRFELEEKRMARTKTLSKGLKQRLNLCMALLHDPSILILDEPMSGLDPFSVRIVRNQILEFKREGKTILITTHNMKEAQRICDRILIMNKGKIIADQTPENLLKNIKPSSKLVFQMGETLSEAEIKELHSKFDLSHQKKEGLSTITIISMSPLKDILEFNDFIEETGHSVSNLKINESTLEEVFIHLIKNDSIKGTNKQTKNTNKQTKNTSKKTKGENNDGK